MYFFKIDSWILPYRYVIIKVFSKAITQNNRKSLFKKTVLWSKHWYLVNIYKKKRSRIYPYVRISVVNSLVYSTTNPKLYYFVFFSTLYCIFDIWRFAKRIRKVNSKMFSHHFKWSQSFCNTINYRGVTSS